MAYADSEQRTGQATRIETVIVGAGQAGLCAGYYLKQRARPFVILEANARVGDSWRQRWDSLRLFTPARFDGLPGIRFPAGAGYFPTKNEMAHYLENYAAVNRLPVRTGTRVTQVSRSGDGYRLTTDSETFEADNVIVAMSNYQLPYRPEFADRLAPDICQIHSRDYRNPRQLRDGPVLIVGAGNSGSEIARELAGSRVTMLAGRGTGELPFNPESSIGYRLLGPLVLRLLFHWVLTVNSPPGRKLRPQAVSRGGPWIRVREKHLKSAGVRRLARVSGVKNGLPLLETGETIEVENVIWCTGYRPDLSWLDLPVELDGHEPRHETGLVEGLPGFYIVGLHFQYALSSSMIHGVGRDAERVANWIARGARAGAHRRAGSPAVPVALDSRAAR